MNVNFQGEVWYWRGPSPYHFVTVPEIESDELRAVADAVTYGWGMVPVTATIGRTRWATALWPKDERYIVPLKDAVRKAEGLAVGDTIRIELTVQL